MLTTLVFILCTSSTMAVPWQMHLRERQWRQIYYIRKKLPKVSASFTQSKQWLQQRSVLEQDLPRMPPMNHQNVTKIIRRFAATLPYAGYTQGNLYLVYAIGMVFKDELTVFWAFACTVQKVHRFGPTTPYGVHIVPDYVFSLAPGIERSLWDIMVRFRWLYIMFGQTFPRADLILPVWDYILISRRRMFNMCAALVHHGMRSIDFSECHTELEKAQRIIGQVIDTPEEVASLISHAQQL